MLPARRTRWWTLLAGLPVLLLGVTASYAGKCCTTKSAYPACSGCLSLSTGSVDVGNNSAKKCATIGQPYHCDEASEACVLLTDAPLYSTGCGSVVGVISIEIQTSQCGSEDSSCSAG